MADRFFKVVCKYGVDDRYYTAVYDSEEDRFALFGSGLDDPLIYAIEMMNDGMEGWAWEKPENIPFVALPVKETRND